MIDMVLFRLTKGGTCIADLKQTNGALNTYKIYIKAILHCIDLWLVINQKDTKQRMVYFTSIITGHNETVTIVN